MKWFRRREQRQAAVPMPSVVRRPRVFVPEAVLRETERLLASTRDHEEVVYWAGVETENVSVVVSCVAPEAATTYGSFDTTAASNAIVINWIADRGLVLLAQLHCHPGHNVGHSRGDDKGALMPFENFISIVVPNHGHDGIGDFQLSGVHRYDKGRFVRLTGQQVAALVSVIPTAASFRETSDADLS